MTRDVQVYRLLLRLYPRAFRAEFADDLAQLFADLLRRDGRRRAWRRCLLDAAVTIPSRRLELVMGTNTVPSTLIGIAALAPVAGLATLAAGAVTGLAVLLVGMSFVAWQRARLARLGSAPRRRRSYLWAAALLGGLFAATVASWLTRISGDADLGGTAVLVHNAVGLTALAGCLGCLMAALRPATTDVS